MFGSLVLRPRGPPRGDEGAGAGVDVDAGVGAVIAAPKGRPKPDLVTLNCRPKLSPHIVAPHGPQINKSNQK